jgi:hypothetical protein
MDAVLRHDEAMRRLDVYSRVLPDMRQEMRDTTESILFEDRK